MSSIWTPHQQAQFVAHHRAVLQSARFAYRQALLQNNIQGQQQAVQTAQNAHQAIYQNNNLTFQQPVIHPAILNYAFPNPGTRPTIQNHDPQPLGNPHAHYLPLQNPAVQNVSAVNTTVRPKAPTRKRAPRKPKTKQPLKDVPFPFMDLPVEIRIMIYRLLLKETSTNLTLVTQVQAGQEVVRRGFLKKQQKGHRGRQIFLKTVHKPKDKDIVHFQPVVLRLCKSIHDEAIPTLYGQTLEFEHPVALQKFLFTVGPDNRLLLQHIVLRGWQRGDFSWRLAFGSALERLLSAQNLKSIHLDRHIYSRSDGVEIYPQKYEMLPVNHFNGCAEFWVQSMNAAKGKGSARSIVTFADRTFGSEDGIAQGDQQFLDRKKVFMDNLKLE